MDIYQKLLFERVGFTPATLKLLNGHCGDKPISDRTARRWASGESEINNPYYVATATILDTFLTLKAVQVVENHGRERIILPFYASDDDYWTATGDMPCPVSVYWQLVQRIMLYAGVPVFIDNDDPFLKSDWDNYLKLAVEFDFDNPAYNLTNDPFELSVDDDSDL